MRLTARLFPEPDLRASRAPGPMLLLRDLFLLSANVVATSIVAFSLSVTLRGETPLVDLRGRRVAGSVASSCEAIVTDLWLINRHSFNSTRSDGHGDKRGRAQCSIQA
jgi:hypothetical protein